MSHRPLTIVIGFRDRERERVERCLGSLEHQSFRDFQLILVDYGSASASAARVRALTQRYDFCRYVYTDTRGHPWSRSCALNVGVRLAETEYVLTTDVDMIFPPEFVASALEQVSPGRVLHAWCTFLPERFRDWATVFVYRTRLPANATRQALGGCQCLATRVLREIGGFDEYYRFWGAEDRDLTDRLLLYGLEEHYLPDTVPMFHQWHPSANDKSDDFMPRGMWGRMNDHQRRWRGEVVRNREGWGRIVRSEDRPALGFLDFEAGRLLERPELHQLHVRPDRPRETGELVQAFWDLPPGHALAVGHAFFPRRSALLDLLIRALNAAVRRFGAQTGVGYRPNLLHAYLVEMLETNRGEIADYYLGFPARSGVSLIVRAEAESAAP